MIRRLPLEGERGGSSGGAAMGLIRPRSLLGSRLLSILKREPAHLAVGKQSDGKRDRAASGNPMSNRFRRMFPPPWLLVCSARRERAIVTPLSQRRLDPKLKSNGTLLTQ